MHGIIAEQTDQRSPVHSEDLVRMESLDMAIYATPDAQGRGEPTGGYLAQRIGNSNEISWLRHAGIAPSPACGPSVRPALMGRASASASPEPQAPAGLARRGVGWCWTGACGMGERVARRDALE